MNHTGETSNTKTVNKNKEKLYILRTSIPPREKGDRESHQAKQPKKCKINKITEKSKI
jgi:hypothetical protein